jgi:hypothetical protein
MAIKTDFAVQSRLEFAEPSDEERWGRNLAARVFICNVLFLRAQSADDTSGADFVGIGSGCKSFAYVQLFRDAFPELIHIHTRQIQLAYFFPSKSSGS